uniref:Ig-like domain-containing protein n=1 Tax=Gopherus evgoodei TaxID=1825980 RepID=A0A8C4W019_9SAUR
MLQIHINFWFSFLALFLDGCAQMHLRQAQLSITRAETKTTRIVCEASGIQNFGSAIIHWYRHRPGEAPEWILYISTVKVEFDKDTDKKKFDSEKVDSTSTSNLRVHQLTREDAATYYCATWDRTALESHRQPLQKPTLRSEPNV